MVQKTRNPAGRRLSIQRQVLLDGTVTVETLARDLDVSVATIRRDLTSLEEEGLVRRTHGGAVFHPPRGADQAMELREQIDPEGKARIARRTLNFCFASCDLVCGGEIVLVASGVFKVPDPDKIPEAARTAALSPPWKA